MAVSLPMTKEQKAQKNRPEKTNESEKIEHFVMEPCVGTPIRWYPHGNPNERPLAAVCVEAPGRGMIGILAQSHTGLKVLKRAVPHISDPHLLLHPPRDPQDSKGGWDWLEDEEFTPKRFRGLNRDSLRIIGLYQRHGKKPAEIAELMGSSWNADDVRIILARRKVLKPEDATNR